MGVSYIGQSLTSAIEDVSATVTIDENGIAEAQETYTIAWSSAVSFANRKYRHPDYSWLVRKKAVVRRIEGGLATVTIDYEGVSPDATGGSDGEPGRIITYSLEVNTSAEPIETHPDFRTFAGQAKEGGGVNETTGATWDAKKRFTGFAIEEDGATSTKYYANANLNKAGVTSYLVPGVTYTQSITNYDGRQSSARLNLVGKISNPPSSDILPKVAAGRDWLLIGANSRQVGDGINVEYKWRLSGPNGWDQELYS